MPKQRPKGEREARLKDVARMIALMTPHHEIVETLRVGVADPKSATYYSGVTDRQARYDIETVYERMQVEGADDRGKRHVKMRRALELVYRKALSEGDYKAAVQALDRICRLDGLYSPTTHQVAGVLGVAPLAPGAAPDITACDLSRLSDDELAQLDALVGKASAPALEASSTP